jgi:hypothetical protein
LIVIGLAVAVLGLAAAVYNHVNRTASEKREAAYRAGLEAYTHEFQPGLSRKDVEHSLRAKGVHFTQMCCVDQETSAFADLVNVGEESAPWFCSHYFINVALVFTASQPRYRHLEIRDTDLLKSVRIFRQLDGCL